MKTVKVLETIGSEELSVLCEQIHPELSSELARNTPQLVNVDFPIWDPIEEGAVGKLYISAEQVRAIKEQEVLLYFHLSKVKGSSKTRKVEWKVNGGYGISDQTPVDVIYTLSRAFHEGEYPAYIKGVENHDLNYWLVYDAPRHPCPSLHSSHSLNCTIIAYSICLMIPLTWEMNQ